MYECYSCSLFYVIGIYLLFVFIYYLLISNYYSYYYHYLFIYLQPFCTMLTM